MPPFRAGHVGRCPRPGFLLDAQAQRDKREITLEQLPAVEDKAIAEIVQSRGMTLAMHLCRGNLKSTHAAAGDCEPVVEALLAQTNLDACFMAYDDARSGDFRPLRFLPENKIVVLGLVTTKFGAMESKDDLKRRIDEAATFAPLDQLCLLPQCGFSSTVHGNNIAVQAQRDKLALMVEVAGEVWG